MYNIAIDELSSTPIGSIWVAQSDEGLIAIEIGASQENFARMLLRRYPGSELQVHTPATAQITQQLSEYLLGERREFSLLIDWTVMSAFQEQVLRLTAAIPYGQTTTYGEIARQLGRPRLARAVGRAEATNPVPLVIPCHRVVGADSGLHGYGAPGGILTKAWLLHLEGRQ